MFSYMSYFKPTPNYYLPYIIDPNNPTFVDFKNKSKLLNKVMFALNNLGDELHTILFSNNPTVCNILFTITITVNNKEIIDIHHNLTNINDFINNQEIEYIYIRINVIRHNKNTINHINNIIINKPQKYILLFDPQITFDYNPLDMITLLFDILQINYINYNILFPEHIGYDNLNKLQYYDNFCQSYTLLAYILIINNPNVPFLEYNIMFNNSMTYKKLGYFLFYIHTLLQQHNFDICDQYELWSYPTDNTGNLFNFLSYIFSKKDKETNNKNQLIIKETDDFIVVETE